MEEYCQEESLAIRNAPSVNFSISKFIYPDRLSNEQIRLVKLHPGKWKDEIRCTLVHVYLPEKPEYQALSYVWGSQNTRRPIQVNDKTYLVTANLECALRHLRTECEALILWIDALSINQDDPLERNAQVQIMGKIYSCSANAIIYLKTTSSPTKSSVSHRSRTRNPPTVRFTHTESDSSYIERFIQSLEHPQPQSMDTRKKGNYRMLSVFSLIRLLADNKHLSHWPLFQNDQQNNIASTLDEIFETLRRLMHAPFTPWWSRVWVVQEVVLPRQVQVMHGRTCAPWSMFAAAARSFHTHISSCCSSITSSIERDHLLVLNNFSQQVRSIEELRADSQIKARQLLLTLQRRFRNRKATDPRDKVFALLGLIESKYSPALLYSGYRASVKYIFCEATISVIHASRSLSTFSVPRGGEKWRGNLPTWTPDWNAPGDAFQDARVELLHNYDTYVAFPVNITRHDSFQSLSVVGKRVDTIAEIGDIMWIDSLDESRKTLIDWCTRLSPLRPGRKKKLRFKAITSLCKLFCADIVCLPSSQMSPDVSRRTEAADERALSRWATIAKRSPFVYTKSNRYGKYWPQHRTLGIPRSILPDAGEVWVTFLDLKFCVENNDIIGLALRFSELYMNPKLMALVSTALEKTAGPRAVKSYIEERKGERMRSLYNEHERRKVEITISRDLLKLVTEIEKGTYHLPLVPTTILSPTFSLRSFRYKRQRFLETCMGISSRIEKLCLDWRWGALTVLGGLLQRVIQKELELDRISSHSNWSDTETQGELIYDGYEACTNAWKDVYKQEILAAPMRLNDTLESEIAEEKASWTGFPWSDFCECMEIVIMNDFIGMPDSEAVRNDVAIIDKSVMIATTSRRLLITTDGFVGLGPAEAKQGDQLVLLNGGRTPFLLRAEESREQRWQLVGDCYTHGLMDSALVEENLGTIHNSGPERFHLV